jgi:hypothetical protein
MVWPIPLFDFNQVVSHTDLNNYLRDNLLFLRDNDLTAYTDSVGNPATLNNVKLRRYIFEADGKNNFYGLGVVSSPPSLTNNFNVVAFVRSQSTVRTFMFTVDYFPPVGQMRLFPAIEATGPHTDSRLAMGVWRESSTIGWLGLAMLTEDQSALTAEYDVIVYAFMDAPSGTLEFRDFVRPKQVQINAFAMRLDNSWVSDVFNCTRRITDGFSQVVRVPLDDFYPIGAFTPPEVGFAHVFGSLNGYSASATEVYDLILGFQQPFETDWIVRSLIIQDTTISQGGSGVGTTAKYGQLIGNNNAAVLRLWIFHMPRLVVVWGMCFTFPTGSSPARLQYTFGSVGQMSRRYDTLYISTTSSNPYKFSQVDLTAYTMNW